MAIGAVSSQGHPEGMVRGAMLDRKGAVTGIALGTTTLADSDGNKCTGSAMAGGATAMLLG